MLEPGLCFALLVGWLLSYLLHSSVLLGATWLAERAGLLARLPRAAVETLWRGALFGGLLSASMQLLQQQALPQPPPAGPAAAIVQRAPALIASASPDPAPSTGLARPAPAIEPGAVAPAAAPRALTLDLQPLLQRAAGLTTLLWLIVAALGLALLPLRLLWLRRIVRRLPLSEDAPLQRFAAALCHRAGLRTPRLRLSARWSSPLLAPGGEVCLPLWFSERLNPAQREAVLAHELAHLRRRDPAWRLAAQLTASLGWLQPLNALARRRLDALAELACDDWAARVTGHRQALAESLYVCAQQLSREKKKKKRERTAASPSLATAMAGAHSPLLQRMRSLLEETRMDHQEQAAGAPQTGRRNKTLWLAGGALLAAALLLPAVVVRQADAFGGEFWAGFSRIIPGINIGPGSTITSTWPDGHLRIRLNGKVRFNEAEDELQELQGRFEVEEQRDGRLRHLLIESQAQGTLLKRSYALNGKPQPIDADAQAWIARMMGVAADATVSNEARVKKLFARGGVEAVLANIEQSGSEYARRSRVEALLRLGPLDTAATARVLAIAQELGSDFDRRKTLQALIKAQALNDEQQQALLRGAARIGSDFDLRELLLSLTPQLSSSAPVLQAWLEASQALGSDFDLRTVLEALMQRDDASSAQVEAALQASLKLGSDFDHRSALTRIARRLDARLPAQFEAYNRSAAAISSDFERRTALIALIEVQPLDKAACLGVLNAIDGIASDYERVTVMRALAQRMAPDQELVARYRQLARGLGDHERGQAEKALDHLAS